MEYIAILEILFIIVIVWFFISPLLVFMPWYKWWRQYDPDHQSNCFSLSAIAYYKYNNIAYRLLNFITPPRNQFKHDWWVIFIAGIMVGEAIGIQSNGICTPKSLCVSLIPTDYPTGILPGLGRQWPTNVDQWRNILLSWTGMGAIPSDPSGWNPNEDTWNNNPDNFLARWGITPNSPAVIAFITNWGKYNGDTIFPSSLEPLLGISGAAGLLYGGWFGYLQQGDNFANYGLDEANRNIWSDEIPENIAKNQQDAASCSGASIAQGALGTGMGGAFAGAAIITGPLAPVGAAVGFLIGAIVGGLMGAWGGNCL